jgi:polar amino acid transport system substrate-binding protein
MELDNFSSLRAIIGYEPTNNILVTFANYLNSISQEFSFSVYHTMHNSFVLLLNDINNETDIYSVINLIQDKLKSLYRMENSILHLTVSVGIALYPDNSSTGELLNNAYKALSQAESKGEGWVQMYKPVIKEHGYDELKLYNDMHAGLKRNEFEIFYQPIVDSKTRKIISAEALIRWKHPEHGMVRPDIFIPIMEKTGFIIKLGRFILEEVIKQQKRWELFKFQQIPISINLSLAELERDNFVRGVEVQLQNHNVSPELIKYEITEGLAMENEERTYQQLKDLRKMGVNILLDDFGTGYTSFSYLKKIPANIVKIDRSLVINILTSKTDQGITQAIIDLTHSIGMKVVVEGVEDEHMFNMLRDMGADYIQGYYISRPVPVFEFQKFLRK